MDIFHACDIRGVVGQNLTDFMARRIALAIGTKLTGQRVVVGGDVRLSTPSLQHIMIEGLTDSGCHVIDIGAVATPLFYYALQITGATGGVMITASHNPPEYNGFKLVLGPDPVTEEDIAEIARLVETDARVEGNGSVEQLSVVDDYINHLVKKSVSNKLRVVVDAGNGATSCIAPVLFQRLGYDVVELFCEPDGNFPNRPPNPALAENLTALSQRVIETNSDLGVAFDGDGDRVGFVDNMGRPVANDDIIVLLARQYLKQHPGAIVYDAKCSMTVPEEIKKAGGQAVMSRAGHTFCKAAFKHHNALFGGEISGHFFFRELGYDDGMFAALKVCELVAAEGPLAKLVNSIPKYVTTPDIRVSYTHNDKAVVLDQIAAKLANYNLNLIDGVRIEFEDGWGMIRSSVTEPLFTLRFEAKTPERLQEIQGILLAALPADLRQMVALRLQ